METLNKTPDVALPVRGKRLSPTYESTGTVPTHQKVYTSLLTKLTHQGAGNKHKKNYDPVACREKSMDTVSQTKWSDREICYRWKQDKNSQDQINEEEISNLLKKEYGVLIVKMIQDLGSKMEAWIRIYKKCLRTEELKNKTISGDCIVTEMKSLLGGIERRITEADE